jgi:hypothetical protein
VSKIIPSWYASEEDLKNLCSPWTIQWNYLEEKPVWFDL